MKFEAPKQAHRIEHPFHCGTTVPCDPAALNAGFVGVNGFFAAVLVALVALASVFPSPILWVLGGRYGALHSELVWMVVAATLSAWGGTLYGVGCDEENAPERSSRGGSWDTPALALPSSAMVGQPPSYPIASFGVRCMRAGAP